MRFRLPATIILMSCAACQDQPSSSSIVPNELQTVDVVYNGELISAQIVGDVIVVEGDIVIGTLAEIERDGGVGSVRQAVRIQGRNRRWTNGTVPFDYDPAVTQQQRNDIQAAMDDWMDAVSGLTFVTRTTEADYIRFFTNGPNTSCGSSPVGKQGGQQNITYNANCLGGTTVHHEIAHSLGFFHEHTRKGRDAYVTVAWANVIGCPNSATASSDCGCAANQCGCGANACNFSHNFTTDSSRSDILDYDFESIMHYPLDGFSKNGNDTLVAIGSVPAGVGNATELSELDVKKMNAVYPVIAIPLTVFQSSEEVAICELQGRERDIATSWDILGWPVLTLDNTVVTSVTPGDYSLSCRARSAFWARNYDYPNSTVPAPSTFDSQDENFYVQSSIRVLSAGLIPVILNL